MSEEINACASACRPACSRSLTKSIEISRSVFWGWQFAPSFTRTEAVIIGHTAERRVTRTDQITWIDAKLRWALCEDAFWWLDREEEK